MHEENNDFFIFKKNDDTHGLETIFIIRKTHFNKEKKKKKILTQ